MAHVGVHGLAAGHGQEGRSEDREADPGTGVDHEAQRRPGIDGLQDGGGANDPEKPQDSQDQEPAHHDGAEDAADEGGAAMLHEEQSHKDHDGDGQHKPGQ